MTDTDLVFLSDKDVREILDLEDLLGAVTGAYSAAGSDISSFSDPRSMTVFSTRSPRVSTMTKGAAIDGVIGARVITSGDRGSRFVFVGDAQSGEALGIVDERTAYAYRVGAQAALACQALAPGEAKRIALIGTGNLARGVARCLFHLMPDLELIVTSRRPESVTAFAQWARESLDRTIEIGADVEGCCRSAAIVVTATTASTPLITLERVRRGMLFVAIGGGVEISGEVIAATDRVFADDITYCREIGSLVPVLKSGSGEIERRIEQLGAAVTGKSPGRRSDDEIIVAIPQGLATADLAVAALLVDRARSQGVGARLSVRG